MGIETDKATEVDEVALNALLLEDAGLPTALAASVRDDDPKPLPPWVVAACWILAITVGLLVYFSLAS